MKRATKVTIGIGLFILLLVATALFVVATLDWNRFKPTINERVSEALGRPFAIAGDLSVEWQREPRASGWRGLLPWMQVTAQDVRIGNPEWASAPEFATSERIHFRMALLPLLRREVEVPYVQVQQPAVWLERLADGRANWDFERPEGVERDGAWDLDVGVIEYDQGRVALVDAVTETEFEAQLDPLGEPIPFRDLVGGGEEEPGPDTAAAVLPYVFGWHAEGRFRGHAFTGAGNVGGLLALRDARRPLPVQAEVQVGDTHIAVEGTLIDPRDLAAFDLRLRLSGANLAELYSIARMTLPDTREYSTDGRLSVQLREAQGAIYRYHDFTGRIGDSDVRGNLTFTASAPRTRLEGELVAELLRFVDLAPLIGLDPEVILDDGTVPVRALPTGRFRTERWPQMDAEVKFSAQHIDRGVHLPFTDLHTHLSLDGGLLWLEPLDFGIAGGNLTGRIVLDGRASPMPGHVHLWARQLGLAELFPGLELMQASKGQLNGEIELDGTGETVAELLGSADGDIRMVMFRGVVSRGMMELAGLNLGAYVLNELFGDDEEVINCVLADFNVQQGVMHPRVFVFDTENAQIKISGTVNLANERLDLEVEPHSKGARLISLRSPLYVRGTFMAPDIGVETGQLAARGLGALALGAVVGPLAGLLALFAPGTDGDDPCLRLLPESGGETR